MCLGLSFVFSCGVDLLHIVYVGSSCATQAHMHTLVFAWWRSLVVSRLRIRTVSRALEHQLGALLQAQQMMQQNMVELMIHFASEKSEKSEKKTMEQLDWRAMGETWREPDDEEGHDFRGGAHREGPGCDL